MEKYLGFKGVLQLIVTNMKLLCPKLDQVMQFFRFTALIAVMFTLCHWMKLTREEQPLLLDSCPKKMLLF